MASLEMNGRRGLRVWLGALTFCCLSVSGGSPAGAVGPDVQLKAVPALSLVVPPDLNTAGLEIALEPSDGVRVGERFKFTLKTREPGYLIILDVNAEGAITQIYPNVFSLKLSPRAQAASDDPCRDAGANTLSSFGLAVGADPTSNHLNANQTFELPGTTGRANYSLRACPPLGSGFVLAILSDRPLQMVDLPDLAGDLVGKQAGLDHLIDMLRSLRVVSSDAPDPAANAHRWSVAVKDYRISAR